MNPISSIDIKPNERVPLRLCKLIRLKANVLLNYKLIRNKHDYK